MYENIKYFLKEDLAIKRELFVMVPPNFSNVNSEAVIVKYTDKLYDSLKEIFKELKAMIKPFNNSKEFIDKIEDMEIKTLNKFMDCKLDLDKLSNFYLKYVSDLSEDVVDIVKKEIHSSYEQKPTESLKKCKTINEMLHIMHFFVMNNSNNLEQCELVSKKQLDNGYPVNYYGEENEISFAIYNMFPSDIDCGVTDILSLGRENKVIMMIRDRGHALSIEIEKVNPKTYGISYFIPKICNSELVNELPGVNKVDDNAEYYENTTGVFYSSIRNFIPNLFTFINMVPMDKDIVIKK